MIQVSLISGRTRWNDWQVRIRVKIWRVRYVFLIGMWPMPPLDPEIDPDDYPD